MMTSYSLPVPPLAHWSMNGYQTTVMKLPEELMGET